MVDPRKYREQLVRRRCQLIGDLADFERGDFTVATRRSPASEWRDETKDMIEHYKHQIEVCDRMIAMLDETLGEFVGMNTIH